MSLRTHENDNTPYLRITTEADDGDILTRVEGFVCIICCVRRRFWAYMVVLACIT